MSAQTAFGRSLPSAKLTAHDPRLVQIFTTTPSHLARGDFGFKAPLVPAITAAKNHRVGLVRYVQVKEQDSTSGAGLDWKEREREVLVLKQWGETHSAVQREDYVRTGRPGTKINFSRFDRSSRQRSSPTPKQQSAATLTSRDQLPPPPNYLLYSEKRFEGLLDLIRSHRQHYKETRLMEMAMDQRSAKFRAAQRNHKELLEKSEFASAGVGPLPDEPKIEDFPVEVEVEAIRNSVLDSDAIDVELDPLDMLNLARSTYNHFASAYVRNLLADINLNRPESQTMPRYISVSQSPLAYAVNRLHDVGGLQYSQPDEIFTSSLAAPLPGRILTQSDNSPRYLRKRVGAPFGKYHVLVGSQVHRMRPGRAGNMQLLAFDREGERPNQGVGLFRPDTGAHLRLSDGYLDTLPAKRRYGGFGDGAWTTDMQSLGLGYLEMALRAIPSSGNHSFKDRVDLVGEETARSETIPGARGWVGKEETPTSNIQLDNPFRGSLSELGLKTGLGSNSARAGPGAIFSDAFSSSGNRGESKVKFSRGGFRRNNPNPGQGASQDGNQQKGSGASRDKRQWLGISESLFG